MAKRGERKYGAWVKVTDPDGGRREVIIGFYADPDLEYTGGIQAKAEQAAGRRWKGSQVTDTWRCWGRKWLR